MKRAFWHPSFSTKTGFKSKQACKGTNKKKLYHFKVDQILSKDGIFGSKFALYMWNSW